jgi:hypothetical protein
MKLFARDKNLYLFLIGVSDKKGVVLFATFDIIL